MPRLRTLTISSSTSPEVSHRVATFACVSTAGSEGKRFVVISRRDNFVNRRSRLHPIGLEYNVAVFAHYEEISASVQYILHGKCSFVSGVVQSSPVCSVSVLQQLTIDQSDQRTRPSKPTPPSSFPTARRFFSRLDKIEGCWNVTVISVYERYGIGDVSFKSLTDRFDFRNR